MSRNRAESIRQRLLDLSKERSENFDYVLRQYVIQRLLYRLCQSHHEDKYLLKGAQLFWIWNESLHRPTHDVDLLGFGENDVKTLVNNFQDICCLEMDDGLQFDYKHIKGIEIKENDLYQGVRITGHANLTQARIPFQVDIGFGDIVIPDPEVIKIPSFLDLPQAVIRAYSFYTVVAEKFQAMVYLGIANSRMKDLYDVWFLASSRQMDGTLLAKAVKATFARRETTIIDAPLTIFSEPFTTDSGKISQWGAFINKNQLADKIDFAELMLQLQTFLEPVYQSIAKDKSFTLQWSQREWQ